MKNYESIQSLEDAYKATKFDPTIDLFQNPSTDRQIAANSFTNATVLTEAINQNDDGSKWIPDFDTYEDKYEIWWRMRSEAAGGPGFSYHDFSCGYSRSCVGARLVFRSRARAKYAATTFPHIFKPFMTMEK
ncbi:hypothetical protein [Dyadobacter sp. LHD-138]|uniref:hypothetical protein n=1 Tax=Dyadobacter sp. LHD-138 TaxID=3071413 RepID=UPI0027DF8057|nr:hypothetical protein [Dyadobacter sp. LHD-138]MDQ6477829.1 hypothetical protein [Dyadobacter sp. LHD-138]